MIRKRVNLALCWGVIASILLFSSYHSKLFPQVTDPLQSQYEHALKMLGEENYKQALSELRQIIQEHPEFSQGYRRLVETYIFINDLAGAQTYFETLLQENPNNPYAYYALARINFVRKEYNQAIDKLKKSILLDPKFADAYSYRGGLPEVYKAKKDLDSAIQFFEQLIEKDLKNAFAYYGLARSYIRKYEWDKALNRLTKAIELDPELTLAYHSMIYIFSRTSRFKKVLTYSEKLLKIAKKVNDFEMISYATMMIGNSYFLKGDYLNSLNYFNKALKVTKQIGDKRREGACLNNIAAIYAMSANFPKALQYFKEALVLARNSGDKRTEISMLTNIGNVYKDHGNYHEGLKYYKQALERAKKNKYKKQESHALANMAAIYQKKGNYRKALFLQNDALTIAKELKDKRRQGMILRNIGKLKLDFGELSEAIMYYRQALEIGIAIQNAQIMWESYAGLGATFEKQNNTQEAILHYAKAIALYDSVRANFDLESLGSNFLEDKYEAYPSIVQLLAQNGNYKEAFTYSEKFKAKSILDILFQGQNFFDQLLSDTHKKQLKQIQSRLEAAHTKLSKEVSKTNKDERKIFSLDQEITDLELKKAAIFEDLKIQHHEYYQLTYPEILEFEKIHQRLLGKGQALVEYILGLEQLSIFVVTSDTLIYFQVVVSRDSLRNMLANLSPIFQLQKSANDQTRDQIFNPQLADFSIPPAYALYEVLFRPIERQLQDVKELIIVPDDFLFYLPFEILVFDTVGVETPYDFENAKFLLEKFAVSYASSASGLNPNLQRVRKSNKGILALGNPDFSLQAKDPYLKEFVSSNLYYSGSIVRGSKLISLPNSESEVKAIDRVFGGSNNSIVIGTQATEENFKAKAEDYRILHLATHFLINDTQPLYSKIVLSQNNKTNEDGYLQTYEVFNMNLNADLVVLSACNTGLGKLRKGEGLIGISRAFLFAGVPSLVVSLWSVNDQSTSIIMKSFYQHLKEGFNKRQALRLAKLNYLKSSPSYGKDPFYWAPFILIGDWNPITLPSQPALPLWIIGLVIILVMIPVIMIIRSRMHFARQ